MNVNPPETADQVQITHLLDRLNQGDSAAFDSLIDAVYQELRQMAAGMLRNQRGHHTMQPTALVHEVWLKLSGQHQRWDGRAHFFGAAARAMRQVLVGRARQQTAQKRAFVRVTFRDLQVSCSDPDLDVMMVDEALTALAGADARLARVMELRYFGGLTLNEISELESRSLATIKRDWLYARAWLYEYMTNADASAQNGKQ